MTFYVLDVETANRDTHSICQIGIVEIKNLSITNKWTFLIDPEGPFEYYNVRVHGITNEDIIGAPKFSDIYEEVFAILNNQFCVQHTNFDQAAMDKACVRYNLSLIPIKWVDSAKVAKASYPELKDCGFGLKALSDHFGITFNHHDALEDATATGKVVIHAITDTGKTIEDFYIDQLAEPKTIRMPQGKIVLKPNKEGHFFGKKLVFTGYLKMARKDAMAYASDMGFRVTDNLNFYTDYLVCGKPKRGKKSYKQAKAQELADSGSKIIMISEDEFFEMCENAKTQ